MREEIDKLAFRRRRLLQEKAQAAHYLNTVNSELAGVEAKLDELRRADMDHRVNLMRARAT